MKIEIHNLHINGAERGFVGSCDLRLGDVCTIFGVGILRSDRDPDFVHVTMPVGARTGEKTIRVAPPLVTEINARCAAMYSAATGRMVQGSTGRKPVEEAAEGEDAGLRRVLCAGGEEALEKAGI